ncbi:hypothetical protein BSNK01_03260 [Bacillaceae bacterium]
MLRTGWGRVMIAGSILAGLVGMLMALIRRMMRPRTPIQRLRDVGRMMIRQAPVDPAVLMQLPQRLMKTGRRLLRGMAR